MFGHQGPSEHEQPPVPDSWAGEDEPPPVPDPWLTAVTHTQQETSAAEAVPVAPAPVPEQVPGAEPAWQVPSAPPNWQWEEASAPWGDDPRAVTEEAAHDTAWPSPQQEWDSQAPQSLPVDLPPPGRPAPPLSGLQKVFYQVRGGIRAPRPASQQTRRALIARASTPVAGGHHRVAVLSLKGGVGKTTTAVGLGATLASVREDRVIAVDANPDRGTLCDKLRLETAATVRDLLNEAGQIRRYADVRAYTTQAPSGLEVLASDRDPTVSVAFSDQDYEDAAQILEHY
ncbi:MAG TPA: MinD/ParA family protein, partial [Streptosporangiaceae bacterium]|nr:MinD/ParA family protein [Streptosporangiaceae bacterium]